MNYKIRKARIQEAKTIQKLNHELFLHDFKHDPQLFRNWPYSKEGENYFRKAITDKRRLCLVAVSKEKIIGYLVGGILTKEKYRPAKTAEIDNMLVLEEYRKMGIGSMLVEKFVDWSKRKKVKSVVAWTYSKNKGALKFYQRSHFKRLSVRLELKLA